MQLLSKFTRGKLIYLTLLHGRDQISSVKKFQFARTLTSQEVFNKETLYHANNFKSIPVAIAKGKGVNVWDVDGKEYIDFLSGFATLNMGHCHPRILKTFIDQASTLHHTSRGICNNNLGQFSEYVTKLMGYEKVLVMNTGVEGGETAVKLARRWGYLIKKIPENEATVVFVKGNFWGRTLAAISSSTDSVMYKNHGPFMNGFEVIDYNNTIVLEETFKKNPNIAALMIEPIQGEAGVVIPNDGYLHEVRELCTKYNVLWIADEVQTGLGRTGKLFACDYESVKPDILIIGKALSGGFYPVSAVLANKSVMDCFTPGTHGSTFGGNPLGTKVSMTALQVLQDEGMIQNSMEMGEHLRRELRSAVDIETLPIVRGKGLLCAIGVNQEIMDPWELCLKFLENGLITRPCKENIVRLAPPLMIKSSEMDQSLEIIIKSIKYFTKKC